MANVAVRNPLNKDILQTTKFRLNFTRLENITFFCQTANLPGVSLSEVPRNTPFIDLYVPGEKMMYDTFNVTFVVDENLRGWQSLHDWIRAMCFPTDFKEYRELERLSSTAAYRGANRLPPQYTDATLTVYTNKNNVNFRVKFKDVFPTSVGSILFNTGDTADVITTSDATFRFSYYDIERV
jgi:hypothetical protein